MGRTSDVRGFFILTEKKKNQNIKLLKDEFNKDSIRNKMNSSIYF